MANYAQGGGNYPSSANFALLGFSIKAFNNRSFGNLAFLYSVVERGAATVLKDKTIGF